jgi:PKD repeat protein
VQVSDNIITGYTYGVKETLVNGDAAPVNNLFSGNTTDYYDENVTAYNGAAAINATVAGASGNVSGAPAFITGPSWPWTANGVFTAATFTTLLTDNLGITDGIHGGTGNGLAGWYVNPDITQSREFYIIASTATTATVLGDASAIGLNTKTYRVDSLHITGTSAGHNLGSLAVSGVPADDIDGELRPGADALLDIGSDEIGLWLNAGPDLSVLRNQPAACSGASGGGTAPYTYTWRWFDGSPDTVAQNPSHTYLNSGRFDARLTVSDNTALNGTDFKRINVVPLQVSATGSVKYLRVSKNGAQLRIFWEDPLDTGALFNLYGGNLATLPGGFNYSPITCAAAGTAGAGLDAGWRYSDFPPAAGQVYYLVSASSQGGEGTAGPGADITSGSRCGALP